MKFSSLLMIWLIIALNPPVASTKTIGSICDSLEIKISLSKLILDYIEWRGLREIAIVNIFSGNCIQDIVLMKEIFKILNKKHVSVTFQSDYNKFNISTKNLGIVVFFNGFQNITSKKMNSQISYFHEKYTWLIFVKEMNYKKAFDIIRNLPLRLDTDLTLSVLSESSRELKPNEKTIAKALNANTSYLTPNKNLVKSFENYLNENDEKIGILVKNDKKPTNPLLYEMQQIYKIRTLNNKSCVVNELGVYTVNGFEILNFLTVEKRTNFHHENFRIAIVKVPQDHIMVLYAAFVECLIESLNATLQENIYFIFDTNALRYGLYSSVEGDLSDLGLSVLPITKAKIPLMDYTLEVFQTYRNIYLRQPSSNSIHDIYLSPFSPLLLGLLVIVLILMAIFLRITYLFNKEVHKTPISFFDWLMCCYGILCQQGNSMETVTPSSSVIIISTLAFSVICFNAYGAILTSNLLYDRDEVKSIDDLEKANLVLGVVENSTDHRYLMSSNVPQFIEILERIKRSKNLLAANESDAFIRATQSKLVFFGEQAYLRNHLKNLPIEDQCLISEVPVKSAMTLYGLPTPLKTPYRKVLLVVFLKLLESGILHKLQLSAMPQIQTCHKDLFEVISLSDVFTAFALICCAFFASIMFAVCERYFFRRTEMTSLNVS